MEFEQYKCEVCPRKMEWIPGNILPDKEGRYICDYGNGIDFGMFRDGEWYLNEVVAWMPLPPSYKG